jgi:hypothetical protein
VSRSESGYYGGFVWASRALDRRKWWFPARAVEQEIAQALGTLALRDADGAGARLQVRRSARDGNRERQTERERKTDRQIDTRTQTEGETERERQRERQREGEIDWL